MEDVIVLRSSSVSCMAGLEETCRAVMLRNEKCVNHFLDSLQGEKCEFVMAKGREQFSCHDRSDDERLVVHFSVVQNKDLL
jgi:hypothetical protein